MMQILQAQFHDYVPKYHIFVDRVEIVDKLIQSWQEPTTLWDGHPVLGFMAETYLDDLHYSWFQGLQSNVDISNYICQSMLGSDNVRNGSMASRARMLISRSPRKPSRVNLP